VSIKTGQPIPELLYTVHGLHLGGRSRLSDAEFQQMLRERSGLKMIVFGNALDITDAGLMLVTQHPQLEMLVFSPSIKLSDRAVESLTMLQRLKSLSMLNSPQTSSQFQQTLKQSSR
jgi:hypothetical protein